MNGFKIDIDEIDDNYVYQCHQKVITQIVKEQDETTFKAIQRYCEENDIIPNIISEDKLRLVLQLGIEEFKKRELEKGNEMKRKKELEKVKKLIKEYYDKADCGLYDSRNIVGDPMCTIFKGKYFTLDLCYHYSYFEVFGTTSEEFAILRTIYNNLEKEVS